MTDSKIVRAIRSNLAVAVAFAALTCLLTYPQVRNLATAVPYHSDPVLQHVASRLGGARDPHDTGESL